MNYAKEWVKTGAWGSSDTETKGLNTGNITPAQEYKIIEAWTKSEDECKELFPDINYSQDLQLCAKQQNFQCHGNTVAKGNKGRTHVHSMGVLHCDRNRLWR